VSVCASSAAETVKGRREGGVGTGRSLESTAGADSEPEPSAGGSAEVLAVRTRRLQRHQGQASRTKERVGQLLERQGQSVEKLRGVDAPENI